MPLIVGLPHHYCVCELEHIQKFILKNFNCIFCNQNYLLNNKNSNVLEVDKLKGGDIIMSSNRKCVWGMDRREENLGWEVKVISKGLGFFNPMLLPFPCYLARVVMSHTMQHENNGEKQCC